VGVVVETVVPVGPGAPVFSSKSFRSCSSCAPVISIGFEGDFPLTISVAKPSVKTTNSSGSIRLAAWTAPSKQTTLVMVEDWTQTRNKVPRTPTRAVGVLTLKFAFFSLEIPFVKTLNFPMAILKRALRSFFFSSNLNCSRLRSAFSPMLKTLPSFNSILTLEEPLVLS